MLLLFEFDYTVDNLKKKKNGFQQSLLCVKKNSEFGLVFENLIMVKYVVGYTDR